MTITQHTRRRVLDAIPTEGAPLRVLSQRSGVHISNVRSVAKLLEQDGTIFTARAPTGEQKKSELWAFLGKITRDRFAEAVAIEAEHARLLHCRKQAADRKAKRATEEHKSLVAFAAERRELARFQRRQAEIADKAQAAIERGATQKKLRKITEAAGALVFKRGTSSPAPKKASAWDAAAPYVIPEGLETIELPCSLGARHDVAEAPPLFSAMRPGQYIAPAPAWVEAATA